MKNNKIHSNLIIVGLIIFGLVVVILFSLINLVGDNTIPYDIKFIINFLLSISTMVSIFILLNWKFVYYDSQNIYYRSIYSDKINAVEKSNIIGLTNMFVFNDNLNYRIKFKTNSGQVQSFVFLSLMSKKEIESRLV